MILQTLIAMAGVTVLLVGWVLVQRLAGGQTEARRAEEPEARRDPISTACTVCGSTCGVRVIPPPTARTEAESHNTQQRM